MKRADPPSLGLSIPDYPRPDAVILQKLAKLAIENGWPPEDVAAAVNEAVGPIGESAGPSSHNDNVTGASEALHRLFAEAAMRKARD